MKNLIFLLAVVLLWSCDTTEQNQEEEQNYYQIFGEAQGTTYSIIFSGIDLEPIEVKEQIDSLLSAYDDQNSIYKNGSVISELNESKDSLFSLDQFDQTSYFQTCFNVSKELYNITGGAFNPAVYPLVNYWGFHKADFNYQPDSLEIANLLMLIDFSNDKFRLEQNQVFKSNPESKIDFNALAQGHSVDIVGEYLTQLGSKDFMIEIGGEIACKGKNPDHGLWRVGVDKPVEHSTPGENGFQCIAAFTNKGLATSGNYRKYYEIDGQKYSHTIDPVTGYPARQSLLSVTVITDECIYADAYATAFMVMGLDGSLSFLEEHPELDIQAYFVYDVDGQFETKMTKGFEEFILD